MARIERYLTTEILRPITGVFAILLMVVLIFYISQYLATAAAERLPLSVVGILAGLKVSLFLDVLIPVALFLGIVVGLGRLQSNYEVTALAAAGAGRRRFFRSVLWIAGAALLLVIVLVGIYRPWAYSALYALEGDLVARVDLDRVEPGRFEIGDEQWLIFADRRSNRSLRGVLVHQRLPQFQNVLRADRLHQEELEDGSINLVFSGNVNSYRLERDGDVDVVTRVNRLIVRLTPPGPVEREQQRRAMSMDMLLEADDGLEVGELQWRLLAPVSVLILSLAAVAVSRINPRRGQTARVLIGSLMVAVYFSIVGVLINWVEYGIIAMWPGVFWLPLVVIPLLGLRFASAYRGAGPPL